MRLIISLRAESLWLFVAAFIVLTMGARANSQPVENFNLLFAPYLLGIGPSHTNQNQLPKTSSSEITQGYNLSQWMAMTEGPPLGDLQWRSFGMDYDKMSRGNDGVKTFQTLPSTGGSRYPADQLRIGDSYLGIQTQKSSRTPEQAGRSDCTTDDDCADYSGLPKSKSPKTTTKNIRKPFIGLSITTPLE